MNLLVEERFDGIERGFHHGSAVVVKSYGNHRVFKGLMLVDGNRIGIPVRTLPALSGKEVTGGRIKNHTTLGDSHPVVGD